MMLDENKIVFKAALIAPISAKEDISGMDRWANHTKDSANKIKKGADKAIKTPEDFDKKIAQPTIKNINAMYKDGYCFKSGLSKEDMIAKTREKMKESAKKYSKKITEVYKEENGVPARSFQESVDFGKIKYARSWLKYNFPLFGSKKENIKGLIFLGVMALSGNESISKFLKPGYDNISKGNPLCIIAPENLVKFKKELRSRIARLGTEIIKSGFDREMIEYNSKKLNQLVNSYRLPEFTPFRAGGDSHIDFVIQEFNDPLNKSKTKKRLGLEIQVSKEISA